MAQLTGNAIQSSYLGLLKTTDNAAIGATEKQLTDGAGNNLPLTAGTAGISFTGGADFTNATVTGIPSGGVTAFSTGRVSETQATSSCDTVRASVLIPANTFAAGDILMMRSMQELSNQSGFTYSTIWITTNGTIGAAQGGVNIAQVQSSSNGKSFYEKTLFINTADGTGNGTNYWPSSENNESHTTSVVGGDAVATGAIDWTVNQYLAVSVCIDNSTATWTNFGAVLTKLNG